MPGFFLFSTILQATLNRKKYFISDFDWRNKFKHGVIIGAGTSGETVYVKFKNKRKKTIQTICVLVFLKLPLPAINFVLIIMTTALDDSVQS